MERKVFVIEDDFTKVERVLASIREILDIARKREKISTTDMKEITIYVIHVIDPNEENKEDEFSAVKTRLISGRDCTPTYKYISAKVDIADYPNNIEECRDVICREIEVSGDRDAYSIMLDVVLVKDKDYDAIDKGLILSQILYRKYENACIPYTNYTEREASFRRKWKKGVNLRSRLFERADLKSSGVDIDLSNCLLMHLHMV